MEEHRTFLEQVATVWEIYSGIPTFVTGQAFPIPSYGFNSEILDAVARSSLQPLQSPSFVISALSVPSTVNGLADTLTDDIKFPEPNNLAQVLQNVASLESYTSDYATNTAAVDPVADHLSTYWQPQLSHIRSWCKNYNTKNAAIKIEDYCQSGFIARRGVPPATILRLDDQDTTLITKTVSIITSTEMSGASVGLPQSNFKTDLYPTFSYPMPSPSIKTRAITTESTSSDNTASTNNTSPNPLDRRTFAEWGVTSDDIPPSIGTSILNLPPHRWDCVRRPRACQTLLSLIGVLCGMPFGVLVFFMIKYFWRIRQEIKKYSKNDSKQDTTSPDAEEGTKD